ncbi:MAG: PQQ-like beta-propeller repeat protein [Comamonadaceae bacterium]|nr:PQQ-like beta-propeller repeat protein [Comamonadaceae bacterium]
MAGERVFVMGVDRAVHAFDALDGRRLWTLQRPGDALTLAQAGVLAAVHATRCWWARAPRLAGVDPLRGTRALGGARWPRRAAPTRSSAWPTWSARRCASATGSARAPSSRPWPAPTPSRGALLWSRNVGGVAGRRRRRRACRRRRRQRPHHAPGAPPPATWPGPARSCCYRGLSGAAGRRPGGGLRRRRRARCTSCPPTPARPQLRLPTDGSPVVGTPVLSGTTLLVVTRKRRAVRLPARTERAR